MSQENVEIVRAVYDAGARRDAAAVLSLHDPEVEWDISRAPARELMGQSIYHGHEGLRMFFREWYEAWETVAADLHELIDAGDDVISVETTRGRGRASGASVTLSHHAVWTIREGKISRVVWFATHAEALEAVERRE
jgi:ketosteroid isomerase-like protein